MLINKLRIILLLLLMKIKWVCMRIKNKKMKKSLSSMRMKKLIGKCVEENKKKDPRDPQRIQAETVVFEEKEKESY